jgi:hypothetical protein
MVVFSVAPVTPLISRPTLLGGSFQTLAGRSVAHAAVQAAIVSGWSPNVRRESPKTRRFNRSAGRQMTARLCAAPTDLAILGSGQMRNEDSSCALGFGLTDEGAPRQFGLAHS